MTQLTIPQKINIANGSSVYSSNQISSGKVTSGAINPNTPELIHYVRQGVQWLYELSPSHADLLPLSDYMISLCEFSSKAQAVIGVVGNSIIPPVDPIKYVWYSLVTTFGDETTDINNTSFFTRGVLVDATSVNTMFVNGVLQTLPANFTFNGAAGQINYTPNVFITGDVIAMSFYRKIV